MKKRNEMLIYRFALTVTGFLSLLMLMLAPVLAQETNSGEGSGEGSTDAPVQTDETGDDKTDNDDETDKKVVEEFPLAELPPLTRLVLYNSGVGQLQHEGPVDGKQRLEIKFSGHDIDDVLKSLVFADAGNGSVRAVEYQPAPEPEDVAANTVGMPMTLAQLIQRFRGEAVTFTVAGNEFQGTIYGVETRTEGENVREMVVLLGEEGLQSIELARVDRVHFDKEELRRTLNEAMQGIVKSRKANQKQLDLLLDGEGERDVRFAYVVDMPIWRMTYRLSIKDGKVYLQGWAHVDNVTGVDWEKVTMELRTGKPQSFHINIFAPLMAERPDFGDAVYEFTEGLILVTQWFGFEPPSRFGKSAGGGFGGGGGGLGGGGGGFFGGAQPSGPSAGGGSGARRGEGGVNIESAFRQAAQESRTAQMVRYELDKPVDLGAGRSAALPVFSNELPARLISVFDETDESASPFRAVEITNASGLSMVSGPVSIMRDGDFVGDGKLARLDIDEKAEIVYGVDRAIEIRVSYVLPKKTLASVTLEGGTVVMHYELTRKTVFEIDNRDSDSRDLVLFCDGGDGAETDPFENDGSNAEGKETIVPEPASIADGRLQFDVPIDARSRKQFVVAFSGKATDRKKLDGGAYRWEDLLKNTNAEVSDELRQLLTRLVELDTEIDSVQTRLAQLSAEKGSLSTEQSRVRGNLEVLISNPDAAKPFLDKVQKIEEQIETVHQQSVDAQTSIDELKKKKQQLINER